MKTHLVIPDVQVHPGADVRHIQALGRYILVHKPDVIVQIGDFADMQSLSSYDAGRLAGEGARYENDIQSSILTMDLLFKPIEAYNKRQRSNKKQQYKPRRVLTLGNHENRINKHVNAYPILKGKLSTGDLEYQSYGWEVHDFLETVEIDGILYSHYFPRNAQGRIVQTYRGSPSAALQVQREGRSCTSGHLQGIDFHVQQRSDRLDYGLIAGSFYLSNFSYLCPQGTEHWRGIVMKRDVKDGMYSPEFINVNTLIKEYSDGKEHWLP